MCNDQALELTAEIRAALDTAAGLLVEACSTRVWVVLGYPDWNAYLRDALPLLRLGLSKTAGINDRIRQLHRGGLSNRSIASGLGVSRDHVEDVTATDGVR